MKAVNITDVECNVMPQSGVPIVFIYEKISDFNSHEIVFLAQFIP